MNTPATISFTDGPLAGQTVGPVVLPPEAYTADSYPFTIMTRPPIRGRYRIREDGGKVTATHVPSALDLAPPVIVPPTEAAP